MALACDTIMGKHLDLGRESAALEKLALVPTKCWRPPLYHGVKGLLMLLGNQGGNGFTKDNQHHHTRKIWMTMQSSMVITKPQPLLD